MLALAEERLREIKGRAVALPNPAKINRKESRYANAQGPSLLRSGQTKEAISSFRQAYAADLMNAEIINNLGYAYLVNNDLDDAEVFLEMALRKSPKRATTWDKLGQVLAKKGEIRNAVASFVNV
jgi:Flp pilus assembly protein TadD